MIRVTRLSDFLPIGLVIEVHHDFFENMKKLKEIVKFWPTFY